VQSFKNASQDTAMFEFLVFCCNGNYGQNIHITVL